MTPKAAPNLSPEREAELAAWGDDYRRTHRTVEEIEADRAGGIFPPARRLHADLVKAARPERIRRGIDVDGMAARIGATAEEVARFENLADEPSIQLMARYADALGFRLRLALEPKTDDAAPPPPTP